MDMINNSKIDLSQKALEALNDDEILSIAGDLVRIPSPTEMEREAAAYVKALLKKEGFEVIVQEVEPNRPQVLAYLRGDGCGRSLMLNGHLDVDSLTDSWEWDPYEVRIEGNRLWGHGIHNMKSGVAAFLGAALAVKRSGVRLNGDLLLAAVVGELQGGKGTVHMLASGVKTDMAIVPEPYSIQNIITKCVGVHKFAVNTIGYSIHTSRRELGVDAIAKMMKVIEALKRFDLGVYDPDFPGVPRLHVASIIGGRSRDYDLAGPSHLADICTIIVDMRYPDGIDSTGIDNKIVEMLEGLKAEDPDFRYEYEHPVNPRFGVGGADMPPMGLDPDIEIVRIVRENHRLVTGKEVEGIGAVIPYSYCGNDTAHLQRAGIPCCLYGPRGYDQDVEKHVRIDEMLSCARVLTRCIVDVCVN